MTWAQSYDAVIAKTKTTTGSVRNEYLHQAEDILMSTGAITPIYYYTDIYMKDPAMDGFYSSPLGYKFFHKATVDGATEFTVCVGPKGDTFDPAKNSAVDGAVVISHVYEGLYRWQKPAEGIVAATLEPGQAASHVKSAPDANGHVKYTFTLRPDLKFSDGTALKASDFAGSWARAASGYLGADYGYMFDCVVGYDDTAEAVDAIVSLSGVVADDVAGTIEVELISDVPYFLELTAFPTFAPVKLDSVASDAWWTTAANYIGNGPMKVTTMNNTDGGTIVFEPNGNYWDNANTVATKVTFALSDDDENQLANFESGAWKFIDSVPNAQIESLKAREGVDFFIAGQLGTYYISFNVNDKTLNRHLDNEADLAVFRKALGLLIDRNHIVEEIGQAGQEPANTFVGKGIMEKDDDGNITEWTANSGPNRDGAGYFKVGKDDYAANVAEAVQAIKDLGFKYNEASGKFTNIPSIKYLYNVSSGHKAIAEYLQGAFAAYGITLRLESQEWAVFLNTRKEGNYAMARNGWLADYNDACSFLDMWTSNSGNNDAQFGK
ncbi:MAG: peptide ABC transporter substrate-binding protein [Erysipelotrichia bacterium]|nr:peptide ABC transporter substrate-binding protein [Erysipelotrichia bacterium]